MVFVQLRSTSASFGLLPIWNDGTWALVGVAVISRMARLTAVYVDASALLSGFGLARYEVVFPLLLLLGLSLGHHLGPAFEIIDLLATLAIVLWWRLWGQPRQAGWQEGVSIWWWNALTNIMEVRRRETAFVVFWILSWTRVGVGTKLEQRLAISFRQSF